MNTTINKSLEKHYQELKKEAENFYVTKFIETDKIKNEYMAALDICFDLTGTIEPKGKGLITYNKNYGQGKTFIFEIINHIFRRKNGHYFVKVTNCRELVNMYKEHGEDALKEIVKVKNLFIDDIGDEGEVKVFKHYANELNVLRWVILKRYELWLEKGWRLFGSTNLTKQQIAQEYGGRVADRLEQMAHFRSYEFLSDNKSFRQFNETRRLTREEIKANWAKYMPKKEVEQKVDLVEYMNELLNESPEYLQLDDISRWTLVKDFLLERKLIKLNNLSIDVLTQAKKIQIDEGDPRNKMRRLLGAKSLSELTSKVKPGATDVIEIAEALHAKNVFIKLSKQQGYKFT